MQSLHYASIKGRAEEIIEDILALPPIATQAGLIFTLHLVCEEVVSNIVNYAYPEGQEGELSVDVEDAGGSLVLTFKDKGTPFNPLTKEPPDTSLPLHERPIGGLGIFLVGQMMDDVSYSYVDGCNVLTLKKEKAGE